MRNEEFPPTLPEINFEFSFLNFELPTHPPLKMNVISFKAGGTTWDGGAWHPLGKRARIRPISRMPLPAMG